MNQYGFASIEWDTLISALLGAAMAISRVDDDGAMIEMLTLHDALDTRRKTYPAASAIGALLQQAISSDGVDLLHTFEELPFESLHRRALLDLKRAVEILESKRDPETTSVYKLIVYGIAAQIARSHEEGSLSDLTLEAISPEEQALLDEYKHILDL
ncbi:MAG: hypothetical protein IAE89_02160 [Anaerolineae bacterium]|nr:hypothetical protein [Anaerolineae bacterium]